MLEKYIIKIPYVREDVPSKLLRRTHFEWNLVAMFFKINMLKKRNCCLVPPATHKNLLLENI